MAGTAAEGSLEKPVSWNLRTYRLTTFSRSLLVTVGMVAAAAKAMREGGMGAKGSGGSVILVPIFEEHGDV